MSRTFVPAVKLQAVPQNNALQSALQNVLARHNKGPESGLFTDGYCEGNPGPGGWAFVWVERGRVLKEGRGFEPATTNNRMELRALIEALRVLPENSAETVYSDSQLCIRTINEWAAQWERRGWRRKHGAVKNLQLVQQLWAQVKAHPHVQCKWVKAHAGFRWNEYADTLASTWDADEDSSAAAAEETPAAAPAHKRKRAAVGITIRPVDWRRRAHKQAVVECINSYAADAIGGGAPLSAAARARIPKALAANPNALVLLAWSGEEAVGVANCHFGFATFSARPLLNVHDLAVVPARRGQGIGRALLQRVLEIAAERGCGRVTLEVLQSNQRALALYQSLGFGHPQIGAEPQITYALKKDL